MLHNDDWWTQIANAYRYSIPSDKGIHPSIPETLSVGICVCIWYARHALHGVYVVVKMGLDAIHKLPNIISW